MTLGACWEGLRASWEGLRASWEGLRARWEGHRASWEGPGVSWEAWSHLGGPAGSWGGGTETDRERERERGRDRQNGALLLCGGTIGHCPLRRTDGRTDQNSPLCSIEHHPLRIRCPKKKEKNNGAFLVCGGTIGHCPLWGRCPSKAHPFIRPSLPPMICFILFRRPSQLSQRLFMLPLKPFFSLISHCPPTGPLPN